MTDKNETTAFNSPLAAILDTFGKSHPNQSAGEAYMHSAKIAEDYSQSGKSENIFEDWEVTVDSSGSRKAYSIHASGGKVHSVISKEFAEYLAFRLNLNLKHIGEGAQNE